MYFHNKPIRFVFACECIGPGVDDADKVTRDYLEEVAIQTAKLVLLFIYLQYKYIALENKTLYLRERQICQNSNDT